MLIARQKKSDSYNKPNRLRKLENLEDRLCLTVAVGVVDGDLLVRGEADGPVEINAVGEHAYEVYDNGELIATAEGVSDSMKINIDRHEPDNNRVSIQLNENSLNKIFARLGNGENGLEVSGGNVRHFGYRGGQGTDAVSLESRMGSVRIGMGQGNDKLNIQEQATIGRLAVNLGNGDNGLNIDGDVRGRSLISSGRGDDHVRIGEEAQTGGVKLRMGEGDNRFAVHGSTKALAISGAVRSHAAETSNGYLIAETAKIDGDIDFRSHSLTNDRLVVAGKVRGDIRFMERIQRDSGGDSDGDGGRQSGPQREPGHNQITIAATGLVTGDFLARFGNSISVINHRGAIGGDLKVLSQFGDNTTVNVADDAVIGGELIVRALDD